MLWNAATITLAYSIVSSKPSPVFNVCNKAGGKFCGARLTIPQNVRGFLNTFMVYLFFFSNELNPPCPVSIICVIHPLYHFTFNIYISSLWLWGCLGDSWTILQSFYTFCSSPIIFSTILYHCLTVRWLKHSASKIVVAVPIQWFFLLYQARHVCYHLDKPPSWISPPVLCCWS